MLAAILLPRYHANFLFFFLYNLTFRRKKKKGTRNGNFSKTMKKRLTFKKSGRIGMPVFVIDRSVIKQTSVKFKNDLVTVYSKNKPPGLTLFIPRSDRHLTSP